MTRARKIFAVHPVEILKTEFREPMGVSGRALAKAFNLSAIYEVVRGERVIRAGYGGAVVRPVLCLLLDGASGSQQRCRHRGESLGLRWSGSDA